MGSNGNSKPTTNEMESNNKDNHINENLVTPRWIEQILDDLKYSIIYFNQFDPNLHNLSVVWASENNRTEQSYYPKDWLRYTIDTLFELLGASVPVGKLTTLKSVGSFSLSTS